MRTVLAIDAAWTATQPSGVALVQEKVDRWRCLGVAPSYTQFTACAEGNVVDWAEKPPAGSARVPELLDAARQLAGGVVPDVVTVDMPIANVRFSGRRDADRQISKTFGAFGCSTH